MADNAALDSFLATGAQDGAQPAQEPPQPPEPTAAPEPPPGEPQPPSTPEKPAREAKEAEPDEDEALAQHVQGGDNRTVPFSALEKVRNDWKSKAAAEKAKADLLAQQLEEFKRAQAAPPPAPPPQVQYQPPPDPSVDPVGAFRYMQMEHQRQMLNERLNMSEAVVTERIGKDDLDKYVQDFKAHAEKDPTLWGKLYSQASPYAWMTKEIDRLRGVAEIGDDPAAFRARVIAEERAKWEAEAAQLQPGNGAQRTSPVAGMAPSLASVRSVAGRTTSTFTGPPPLEALFPGHNKRRDARG
jgi:hypothetical protein